MKEPIFRFKGYTDDWKQRKLGDVLALENGYAFQSDYFVDDSTGLVVATPGNVNIDGGFIEDGGKNYSHEGPCPAKFVFQAGDIFVTMTDLTPSANTLGKPAIVPHNEITYLHNQRLGKLVNFKGYKEFLFSMLCTTNYHEQIVKTASGTTVRHSSPERILSYEAFFPDIEEQRLIGQYFKNLDNLIVFNQRKCDALKKLKKGMLQKMFPKDGEKVPEFRFKGFTGDWEQRKLGDVAKFINGRAYSQDELLDNGKYKVLRVGNFYTNDSWYFSDMELEEKYYANDGDLLYTWSATFGPHIWHGDKVIYHYHIWKVDLSDKLDKMFALQLLEQDKAALLANTNGSTMIHVTKAGMEEKQVLLPADVTEQVKIGEYLCRLDNLFALHQRKCDALKELKKGFLQKMFI